MPVPLADPIGSAFKMIDLLGDEVMWHFEFIRFGGRMTMSGLPVPQYAGRERLWEIIDLHEGEWRHGR